MSRWSDEMDKPFETLGLDLTASEDEINRQWRRLMRQVHPDKPNGDEAQTRLYNEAHEKAIAIVRDPATSGLRQTMAKERKLKELDKKHQRFFRMTEVLFNEWEQRCAAQQTEINRMEPENRLLRQQSDAKDEVIQGKDAELARCKQRLSEVDQCLAAADTKATEWEQRFLARCEDDGAVRAQLQQANEMRLRLEQKLKDTGQSVEAAEAKAKEWETKCSVLQENLDQLLANNARSEAQVGAEDSDRKKRKHVNHFGTKEEELTFKNTIASFLQTRFQGSQYAFVPTRTIHKLFTEHTGHTPNNQLFYKFLRDQMSIIFPTATICDRRFSGERERGYNGIQLMS